MVERARVLTAVIAIASTSAVMAAPAQADESEYLRVLQPKYAHLSAQQLLTEGHRVCSAVDSGMSSSNAMGMVQKDLATSVAVAVDIVSNAIVVLGC
jgi:Protein of unknown function (DUF732)